MQFQDITCDTPSEGVLRILQDRPKQRNAQTPHLLEELDQALAAAKTDDDVKVVIIGGVGPHFSAGHDLKEAQENRRDFTVEQRWELEEKVYLDYCLRIRNFPKPTIAQVQGACIAGGFMVANMCDLMVVSDDAFFSDPVLHSLGAAAVEVLVHPYVLGSRKAKEMLFAAGRMSAEDAVVCGMANKMVARDQLEDETLELAKRVARAPAFSTMILKRSINRAEDMAGFSNAISAHFDTHQVSHVSQAANSVRDAGFTTSKDRAKA